MADIVQGFQLLGRFSLIFPFLFVFVVVYALLLKSKLLGENHAVMGFIALIVAALFMFSKKAVTIVNIMAPWFVVLFIFIIFILLSFMIFGFEEKDFVTLLKGDSGGTIVYWIIGLALVIGFGAVSSVVFGGGSPAQGPTQDGTYVSSDTNAPAPTEITSAGSGAFWATLFHPKVLGLILILLISMFTLQKLASLQ